MNLLTICTLRICACVYWWHIAQRLGMAVFMLFLWSCRPMKSIYSDMALDTAMATTKYVLPLPCYFSVARSTHLYLAGFILLLSDTGNGLLWGNNPGGLQWSSWRPWLRRVDRRRGWHGLFTWWSVSHISLVLCYYHQAHVPYMCRGGFSSHPIAEVTNNLYS